MEKNIVKTRTKLINQQQRQAALTIFGPELGRSIVEATQKQVDDLAQRLAGLKSSVAKLDARMTELERRKGYTDIQSAIYKNNGKAKPLGLAAGYYPGGAK
jgi:hypothetical protein